MNGCMETTYKEVVKITPYIFGCNVLGFKRMFSCIKYFHLKNGYMKEQSSKPNKKYNEQYSRKH